MTESISESELKQAQEELWAVWCGIKKIPNKTTLNLDELSAEGRELLEAAIVGQRITEMSVGLHLQGVESTFDDYMATIKPEKLFWMCQIFLERDGSLLTEPKAIQFRNRLKQYCERNAIELHHMEKQFIKKVNSLPFFPVFDWLFAREISELSNSTNAKPNPDKPLSTATPNEVIKNRKEESFARSVFWGLGMIVFLVLLFGAEAGIKHLLRTW